MRLRGIGPALAGNVGTGGAFALSREGGSGCRRSNARSGPIPLPPVRAWWVAICWSFGIGRLGLRFADGLRFLGAGCVAGLAMGLSRGWGSAGSVLRSQGSSEEEGLPHSRVRRETIGGIVKHPSLSFKLSLCSPPSKVLSKSSSAARPEVCLRAGCAPWTSWKRTGLPR